jgi:hypothetical protein
MAASTLALVGDAFHPDATVPMAEHRHLDVFGMLASDASKQHAEESARHEVEEGQGHRRIIPDPILAAQHTRPSF